MNITDFLIENQESEIERSKLKLFRAYQALCKNVEDFYNSYTKDMTEEEKDDLNQALLNEEPPEDFYNTMGQIQMEISAKYKVVVDWDMDIVICYHNRWTIITLTSTELDPNKKLSDLEFEVEPSEDMEFLVSLLEYFKEEDE